MINNETRMEMLKKMCEIRYFEEKAAEYFTRGLIRGSLHTSIGQEGVSVGACFAIEESDYIQTTHRGHGHVIAKGADLNIMMAELLGKVTGYNKGKGGSMHVANLDMGILGANGIVGGGNPVAVGAAFSAQYRGSGQVVLTFFGDGASNQGTFHEAMNLAGAWKLPIVFVNENNQFAISTPFRDISATKDIVDRAIGYGIPGIIADGMDPEDVYEKVGQAVQRAREGNGPTLVECKTYRFVPHSKADREVYRTKEEVNEWIKKCPIKRLENKLIEEKFLTVDDIKDIHMMARARVADALDYGLNSPEPGIEELLNDVFYEEAQE